jgi:hypothetical protein
MSPKPFIISLLALAFFMSSVAIAGHYYGHGGKMTEWNMGKLDANNDNTLTFEEYSENQRRQLRAGFDMIDTDKDGVISEAEWKAFLEVHGVKSES